MVGISLAIGRYEGTKQAPSSFTTVFLVPTRTCHFVISLQSVTLVISKNGLVTCPHF